VLRVGEFSSPLVQGLAPLYKLVRAVMTAPSTPWDTPHPLQRVVAGLHHTIE